MWYLAGFAALLAGAVMQVGPTAWLAVWQVRHLGRDNMTLGFLPGFGLLLLPLLVVRCLPYRPDRPFLCGLQDALWPRVPLGRVPRPRTAELARLRRVRGIMAGLALAGPLVALVPGWLSLQPGDQPPGSPLPVLNLQVLGLATLNSTETTGLAPVLPDYVHLVGAVARLDLAWDHEYIIRAVRYREMYTPLTAPDWRPGDPVAVLQKDRSGRAGMPGPAEGRLSRGLPGWQVTVMRDSGLPVIDVPLVLTREDLHGVVPEPDGVGMLVAAIFGGAVGLTFGGAALGFHRAYRRVLARDTGR